MDSQIAVIRIVVELAFFAAWGFWEYRERDIRHKKAIRELRNGIEPKFGSRPNWGKVTTTVITSLLLFVVIVGGMIFVNRTGLHYAGTVIILAVELAFVAVLLLLMAIRDAGILRKG